MLTALIQRIQAGQELTPEEVKAAIERLASEAEIAQLKADFLIALAAKGETPGEIAAFAGELRSRAVPVPLSAAVREGVLLDVCGTGGDRLNTFNISTTVALVAAAAGVAVAKHGNRAITSQSGSADVLEALGIPTDLNPEQAAGSIEQHGFAFLFAPLYHPAFKHIAPARKICAERSQRTIFNFLGPTLNPARPTAQLLGVAHPRLCEPLARVLQSTGLRRAMVVAGSVPAAVGALGGETAVEARYLDELSTLGPTQVAEFYQASGFGSSTLDPSLFPCQKATLDDLRGGDRAENARIIQAILAGEERGPQRDAVLLNAGAALFVADRVKDIASGWELAEQTIDSGAARRKLEALRRKP